MKFHSVVGKTQRDCILLMGEFLEQNPGREIDLSSISYDTVQVGYDMVPVEYYLTFLTHPKEPNEN